MILPISKFQLLHNDITVKPALSLKHSVALLPTSPDSLFCYRVFASLPNGCAAKMSGTYQKTQSEKEMARLSEEKLVATNKTVFQPKIPPPMQSTILVNRIGEAQHPVSGGGMRRTAHFARATWRETTAAQAGIELN